jgi:hypothetical protein
MLGSKAKIKEEEEELFGKVGCRFHLRVYSPG